MEIDSSVISDIIHGPHHQHLEPKIPHNVEKLKDRLVLPGMIFRFHVDNFHKCSLSLGPGLNLMPKKLNQRKAQRFVVVNQFGVLRYLNTKPGPTDQKRAKASDSAVEHQLWLERPLLNGTTTNEPTHSLAALSRSTWRCTIYQLHKGDRVVGVVLRRAGDNYMIDIGCANPAVLNFLSFEGASKKNRPDINQGDVIYATIIQVDRDLEVILACMDENGRASGMGILGRHEPGTVGNAGGATGGVMLHCSPDLVRRLGDQNKFPFLSLLAKVFPFEVFLGVNGRIWLTARSPRETVLLSNALAMADHISEDECCRIAQSIS